ncbi:hypothetical protein FDECE_6970 [Fusarium decemcellulare]|nr:hypothetical protein FDECE_6970 [Fusarium decemcellulare]
MFTVPSQSSSSRPSGRKGSKKVRTGCITCKIRKVKCDEAKPHCLRCIKTGRRCDGYRTSPNSSPEPSSLSPAPGFNSPAETHAFDYYRTRTSKILSGAIDGSFWSGIVLKMSATEPAVRHAILAISSLHEVVEARSRNPHGKALDTRFAFRQYGNAITSLRNWSQREEPSVIPLLVCLLFICVEFLADRDSAAQMHILQGRKILSGLADGHTPAMEVVKHSLVPIYARLSLSSFLFGTRPAPIPIHLRGWTEVPAVYATVEQARCGLYLIVDECLQFSVRAYEIMYNPNADPEQLQLLEYEQQRLLSQLSRWHAAFTVLTSMSPQAPVLETSQNILRLFHQAAFIWVSTCLHPYEVKYDAHVAGFSAIISLASTIIGSAPTNSKLEPFTFETELVAPVYWTAVKCRHPLLRRAALKLLTREQMRNRRENLWHVRETAVIAARIIEIEETGVENPLDLALSSMTNDSPGSGSEASAGSINMFTCNPKKLKISVTAQPTLPAPTPSFTDPEAEEPSSGNTPSPVPSGMSSPSAPSEPMSPISAALEGIQQLDLAALKSASLESPFGVPENRRIKNALIGPTEDSGGVWTTFFQDPPPGQTQWRITREFLRC